MQNPIQFISLEVQISQDSTTVMTIALHAITHIARLENGKALIYCDQQLTYITTVPYDELIAHLRVNGFIRDIHPSKPFPTPPTNG